MKKLRRTLLFVVFLTFSASILVAEPAFSITGVVHDLSGARIAHARVTARLAGETAGFETETGEQGEFQIAVPVPGTYQVEATAERFKPTTMGTLVVKLTLKSVNVMSRWFS